MLRRGLLVASFLAVSGVASAQTITMPPTQQFKNDVVVLKDGTVLRGSVGEMVPNQSLTITVDGQARKIEWKDIDRVDIDRAKAAAPPPMQAAPTQTMVHIEGVDSDVYVQMLDEHGTTAWTEVCKGACDHELPSGGLYRIRGAGLRASQPFRLEGPRAELHVTTASSAGFIGGLSLVIVGGLAVVNGLSLFLLAEIDKNIISSNTYRDFYIAGGVVTGIGAVALIAGAFLLGNNLRTTVVGAPTVRVPAWREFPQPAPSSRAMALSFPAISGSF